MRIKNKKKGFTLLETMMSALILTIVGAGIAAACMMQYALLLRTAHRMEAINYARSVAEILLETQDRNLLTAGTHAENLPDSYFKDHLKGEIQYKVTEKVLNEMIQIEIIVEWEETFPKEYEVKESLFTLRDPGSFKFNTSP